ncbi:ybl125 [Escherichia coli]|nr:restriction methylase [Escherichia coli]CAD6536868.1 ybl125 [Escherichia coli]
MSEITVSRPEVVNENTDVICSTSVRSRSLEYDNFPEISEANILSTFEQLHQNKDEVFERGVINVFKGLSWDYKTNSPCKFGSKIIVNNLVRWDQWGFILSVECRQIAWLTWKECCICSAVNRSPTTEGISPLIWMTTYSPFRVKDAMKMRCSSLNTLRRDLHTSLSKGWS